MPRRIGELTETGIIADILRDMRRHRANAIAQEPIWTHDTFTAPATYQLTYMPYGINALADNGSVLSEGTDYTVDYTTGLITFTVGRTAGHVIYVSYVTNGGLIAASGPADLGFTILDTFDRANSSSTINPRSDGGTWSLDTGVVGGITSNQGYFPSGSDGEQGARADLGSTSQDVQCTLVMPDPGLGLTTILFAVSPTAGGQAGYVLSVSHDTTSVTIKDYRTLTTKATITHTNFSGGSSAFRIQFNASTGATTVYQDGTSVYSGTISGATGLDTYCGFSTASGTTILFNNFQAKPL